LPEPARPDWIVVALAVAGLLVAGYLTWLKLTGVRAALCVAGSGCDLVQSSRYASLLGVPTALWGVLLYAAVGILGGVGWHPRRWLLALGLVAGAVGASAYLTYLSAMAIGTVCIYCLVSAGITVALLAVLVARRPPVAGRRSPVRPARVAWVGGLAAVGVPLVGSLLFAWEGAVPAGYQAALARHLRDTRAVMYGAFW
jgi:uncharacterized membrane protein